MTEKIITHRLVKIILFCLAAFPLGAKSQGITQIWADYYQYRQLNSNKWKMSNRVGLRAYPDEDYNFRISYRPDFAKNINQHSRFVAGTGLFYLVGREETDKLEIRPWVGYKLDPRRLTSISLTHYFRWENRIYFSSSDKFDSRLRYKITGAADLYRKKGKALSVVLEPEIFVSMGTFNEFDFNRLRTTSGFRFQWNSDWQTEVFATRQNAFSYGTSLDEHDWIIQLKLKHLLIKK